MGAQGMPKFLLQEPAQAQVLIQFGPVHPGGTQFKSGTLCIGGSGQPLMVGNVPLQHLSVAEHDEHEVELLVEVDVPYPQTLADDEGINCIRMLFNGP